MITFKDICRYFYLQGSGWKGRDSKYYKLACKMFTDELTKTKVHLGNGGGFSDIIDHHHEEKSFEECWEMWLDTLTFEEYIIAEKLNECNYTEFPR
jgi:hypothetical protein